MKRSVLICLSAAAFALSPVNSMAEKVKFEDLPEAVQKTVRTQAGSARIEDIDRETRNGRLVYEVAFKKDGKHTELLVLENGALVVGQPAQAADSPQTSSKPLSGAVKVNLEDVPEAAWKTIAAQAKGARIEDIEKGQLNGQTVYQAAFKHEGRHIELRVNEQGQVITPDAPASVAHTTTRPLSQQQLLQAQFDQLPSAVQRTIRMQTGADGLTDIDKEFMDGRTVYEVEFPKDGREQKILIAEDGALVRPPAGQQVIGRTPSARAAQLEISQLPIPVQNTIRAYSGRSPIDKIDRQTEDGQTVYHATFQRGGRPTELQVAQDGSVISLGRPSVGGVTGRPETSRQRGRGGSDPSLAGLPRAVQTAIRSRIGNADVQKIEREKLSGQTYYEIEYEQNGQEHEFHVHENGQIIDR